MSPSISPGIAPPPADDRVAQLRHAFDTAFSRPPRAAEADLENLLAIRVGPDPYALRIGDVAVLVADQQFTRVPGRTPALIGVAGLRGAVVAGYDLRILLGQPAGKPPRWLVLATEDRTIGLMFDDFEGYLRVPRTAIAVEEDRQRGQAHEVVGVAGEARPIIHIPSIVETINSSSAIALHTRSNDR